MGITYGRVPHPQFEDHPITKAEGKGQNNLGQRHVKGVVWHRMIGTLRGTDAYFKMPSTDALTDYGVGVLKTDGAKDDGVIIRWNNPLGTQSGWASGPYNGAYGDGKAFVEYYENNLNVVNRDQASIEISGDYGTELSANAKLSIARITAYWADQYKIPWTQFPIAPEGMSFVRWHQEFCRGTGKVCPGDVVIAHTDELIDMVKAILKEYQEDIVVVPTPPQQTDFVKPDPIPAVTGNDGQQGGLTWYAIQRTVGVRAAVAPRLARGMKTAPRSAPDLKQNDTFKTVFAVQAKNKLWYWITPEGYRIQMNLTKTEVYFK